ASSGPLAAGAASAATGATLVNLIAAPRSSTGYTTADPGFDGARAAGFAPAQTGGPQPVPQWTGPGIRQTMSATARGRNGPRRVTLAHEHRSHDADGSRRHRGLL